MDNLAAHHVVDRSECPAETRRFAPKDSETRRSNFITAVVVGVLTPGLGWLEGFQDWLWLLGFGVAMALLTYGSYWLIARLSGPAVVEIAEDGLAIERKGKRVEIPWADIASVRFRSYGGDSMALSRRSMRGWTNVRLDGHAGPATAEMRSMIEERVAGKMGQGS
ncbi:PH domain-containing protein [Sabulicella rubraurantiaca]|uniref:PH domain-containing protein n=1 Tax=Sabulicella rubraurantiaca TaxID=2811429 RepID=UPI001A9688C5|nr:PH domain-containing protein [Sabulicella rubraurantiaca]